MYVMYVMLRYAMLCYSMLCNVCMRVCNVCMYVCMYVWQFIPFGSFPSDVNFSSLDCNFRFGRFGLLTIGVGGKYSEVVTIKSYIRP